MLVDDTADAMVKMLDAPGIIGQSYNLVAAPSITANEYLDELDRCSRAVVLIGHCRYATHGTPLDNRNNHPHVAGGGYYVIRGAQDRRNKGLYRASQLEYLRLRAKNSVFSDEDWEKIRAEVVAKIWEFLDRMRAGGVEFVIAAPSALQASSSCSGCVIR